MEAEWEPGRWWRITYVGPRSKKRVLWMETSDEREIIREMESDRVPFPGKVERIYNRSESEWREVDLM